MLFVHQCPCGRQFDFVSSDIGTTTCCPNCGRAIEVAVPADVQEQLDTADREREALNAEWRDHDHITDPQPWGDFNGFFDAVRNYAADRNLAMAQLLAHAGVFTAPPTEDYAETLLALRRVSADELRELPPQLREALLEVRQALEKSALPGASLAAFAAAFAKHG
jgi:hypothetical protein